MDFQYKDTYDINDLIHIMRILRAPDGCPAELQDFHIEYTTPAKIGK